MKTRLYRDIAMRDATRFMPVAVLKNGILLIDGHMVYTDGADKWLYVSEDGMHVYMYNDVAGMIKELYKKSDDDDYVITGWDMYPTRFDSYIDDAYNYARFEN
jgi:hypothetical protein